MKGLWYLLVVLLPFNVNANEMKVPFSVEVDFSKKGTVYETDFQAPWNIWGSDVEFYIYPKIEWDSPSSKEGRIFNYLRTGVLREEGEDGKEIPTQKSPYFKLKVTLTPLGWASNDITIWTADYSKIANDFTRVGWRYGDGIVEKKEYKDDEKIEFMTTAQLYGGGSSKTIMIADLQRLKNYHIKVESLEDVELPNRVYIDFGINRHSSKH